VVGLTFLQVAPESVILETLRVNPKLQYPQDAGVARNMEYLLKKATGRSSSRDRLCVVEISRHSGWAAQVCCSAYYHII
jgi:hypothetical protein